MLPKLGHGPRVAGQQMQRWVQEESRVRGQAKGVGGVRIRCQGFGSTGSGSMGGGRTSGLAGTPMSVLSRVLGEEARSMGAGGQWR